MVPRIPGVDQYMAALDVAVRSALQNSVTPSEALVEAARQWEKITDSLGRDSQREAYLKHLGISDL